MRNKRTKRRLAFLLIMFLLVTVGGYNTFRDGGQNMVSHAATLEQTTGGNDNLTTTSSEDSGAGTESTDGENDVSAESGMELISADSSGADSGFLSASSDTTSGKTEENSSEETAGDTSDGNDATTSEEIDPEGIYAVGKANVISVDASQKILRKTAAKALLADSSEATDVPEHHKTITKKGEDLYTVTLDIQGKRQVIEGEKPKVDVLLIVDRSGSMDWSMEDSNFHNSRNSRLKALKSVITGNDGLSEALLGNENMNAQIAVVAYSGFNGYNDAAYNDAETLVGWTKNQAEVNKAVNNLSAGGGTNCEAGLRKGASVLDNSRPDAQKYVIFLTDGEPTYFYANGKDYHYWDEDGFKLFKETYSRGTTLGDGNSDNPGDKIYTDTDGSTTLLGEGICSSRAFDQLEAITGLSGFYSIACSPDASTAFTTKMLDHTDAAVKATYSAKDSQGMINAFKEIKQSITTLSMQNVTIHDEISNYADVVINGNEFGTGDYTLHVKDANGNEVTGEAAKAFETPTLEETDGKQELRLKFKAGYELNSDYTYSISFDIKPSYEAYKALMEDGTDAYAAPAGDGTGFYSNGNAWVTYDYGDNTNLRVEYTEHPTFTLESKTMTIEKQWLNRDGSACKYDHPDSVHIKLTATSPGKDPVVQEFDVEQTDDWKFTMTVPKNYFSYAVEETSVDGYTTSYEKTDDGFLVKNTSKIVETGVWLDQDPAFVGMFAGLLLVGLVVGAWVLVKRRK